MFLGSQLTGLLILSKVQSIVQNQLGKPASEAAKMNAILGGVSIILVGEGGTLTTSNAVCPLQLNLLGRALFPFTSDLIKTRRPLFILSLAVQAVLVGCLPTCLEQQNYTGTLVCLFAITFFCKYTPNLI